MAKPSEEKTERDPLIKSVTEHAGLSDSEKQSFRVKGGTVVEDTIIKK